jgi:hypothetical protein
MALIELDLDIAPIPLPQAVRALLREADRRIRRFQAAHRIAAFVPSDFALAYAGLRALAATGVATGGSFCEWGSGFGVVTCLAAYLGWDACGIEADGRLVDAARDLAEDFGLGAEFACGTFIPPEAEAFADAYGGTSLVDGSAEGYAELERGLTEFDAIYAYPWPGEEVVMTGLFDQFAAEGAVLLTYHGHDGMRVHRKAAARRRRSARR